MTTTQHELAIVNKTNWISAKNPINFQDYKQKGGLTAHQYILQQAQEHEGCVCVERHGKKGRVEMLFKVPSYLLTLLEKNNNMFEIIHQYPYKVYFDIDLDNPTEDWDTFYNRHTEIVEEQFPSCDMAVSGCDKHGKKFSLHIVLNNYMVYDDEGKNVLKNFVGNAKNGGYAFDPAPYGKTQKFKMVGQSKRGSEFVQEPLNYTDQIEKHIITHYFADYPRDIRVLAPVEEVKEEKTEPTPINSQVVISLDDDEVSAEIRECASILSVEYLDERSTWLKIIYSLLSADIPHSFCKELSAVSSKYDEAYYDETFADYTKQTSIGTFFHYCKISNPQEYYKIRAKYYAGSGGDRTDGDIAETFIRLYGQDYICGTYSYFFNGTIWRQDEGNNALFCAVNEDLPNYYREAITPTNLPLRTEKDTEIYKQTNKNIDRIRSEAGCKAISKLVIMKLKRDYAKNPISMELNPYCFCFNNVCFDLLTGDQMTPKREDYMYLSTGYDYTKPTDEGIALVEKLFTQIYPDPILRQFYKLVLATGMVGQTLEKFIICSGGGGNGKSMLNEFFTNMLGNFGSGYAYEAPNGILLRTLPTKNAPEIASMRDKRFVLYREPDTGGGEKATLKCSTIKELTGNQQINARMNHSNDNVCPIKGTHILECNEKPDMGGRKDNGIGRRLLEIEHEARFTGESDEVCEEEHIYKADTRLKENSFKQKYRTALFHIVMNAYVEFVNSGKSFEEVVPERVKEKTQSYLQDSDELYSFITEHYEFVEDKTEVITAKDMFVVYKEFRLQEGLNATQRRKLTEKAFKETLKTNINIKKIYKEKIQAGWVKEKYNKKSLSSAFIGLRRKMLVVEESDDDLN